MSELSKSFTIISELVHLSSGAAYSSNNDLSNWLGSVADNTPAFSLLEKSWEHPRCFWISYEEHQGKKKNNPILLSPKICGKAGNWIQIAWLLMQGRMHKASPSFEAWCSGLSRFDSPFPCSHLSFRYAEWLMWRLLKSQCTGFYQIWFF